MDDEGKINPRAASAALSKSSSSNPPSVPPGNIEGAFEVAKTHLEGRIWDWTDDVEFLGVAWVQFF